MRKLLLLINIVCLCFVSCQNSSQQSSENQIQSPPISVDSQARDTTSAIIQSELPKTVGMEPGITKDTANKSTKGVPVIHTSPEQAKIDSIKKEKLKGKK